MQINQKILAAISGAIGSYLEMEQQAAATAVPQERKTPEAPRPLYSPWAMAGRQSMMEMRQFFQRRYVR